MDESDIRVNWTSEYDSWSEKKLPVMEETKYFKQFLFLSFPNFKNVT